MAPAPAAPIRQSRLQRVSALARFRRVANERKLKKAIGQYGAYWAAEKIDPTLPQVAEAVLTYFEQGGGIEQIIANLGGGEIPGKDLDTFADKVTSKLIDMGLDGNLIEVEIEKDTGRIYVYLDDRIHAQIESVRDTLSHFGTSKLVQDPPSNPTLGAYVFLVEYRATGIPDVKQVDADKDLSQTKPIFAKKTEAAAPRYAFVFRAPQDLVLLTERRFSVKATPILDREGFQAFRVEGDAALREWLLSQADTCYIPESIAALAKKSIRHPATKEQAEEFRTRFESFLEDTEYGKLVKDARSRLLAIESKDVRARVFSTLCEEVAKKVDPEFLLPYLFGALSGNHSPLDSGKTFNPEFDKQDPQTAEAAKQDAADKAEAEADGTQGVSKAVPEAEGGEQEHADRNRSGASGVGSFYTDQTGAANDSKPALAPSKKVESVAVDDRYIDTQQHREFKVVSLTGDQVTLRDTISKDETKVARNRLDSAIVRGDVRKVTEAAVFAKTPTALRRLREFFEARGVQVHGGADKSVVIECAPAKVESVKRVLHRRFSAQDVTVFGA